MAKLLLPIKVTSKTNYMRQQSEPNSRKFIWTYEITIENESEEIIQLLNRYWRITDMNGKVDEIHGAGVVGLQPLIKPGKKFVYSSFCQLVTPQGTMEGHYEVQNLKDEFFAVTIPKFILSAPSTITKCFRDKLH